MLSLMSNERGGMAIDLPDRPARAPARVEVWHLAAALLLGLYSAVVYPKLAGLAARLSYNDFGKFYYGTANWLHGGSIYAPTPATAIDFGGGRLVQFWNMNPPHFHLLIWPLLAVSDRSAFVIWTAANLFAALWSVKRIVRALDLQILPGRALLITALAVAGSPAMAWFVTGQVTGLLMSLTTAIWLEARQGRWTRAGVLTGIAVSFKPFLWPIGLFLALRRAWSGFFAGCAAGLLVFGSGWLLFGSGPYTEWLAALRDIHWTGTVMNGSIAGLVTRVWSLDIVAPPAASVVSGVLCAAVLAVGLWRAARVPSIDQGFGVALTTALLASPLGWIYYLPVSAGPLVATRSRALWLLAGLCLVPYFLGFPYSSRGFALTFGSMMTWTMVAAWLISMMEPNDDARPVSVTRRSRPIARLDVPAQQ
jgi:hypothetical protein